MRWTLWLAAVLWALPAAAGPESIEEARTLMQDGNARLHAGKPAEALEKLERSLALVYSPNTELLLARALRDLGRRVESARAFEHAELEARKRALAGDVKYGMTEASAHEEGAKVRAQLGTLQIHVANASARNATLTVDGVPVPLASAGETSVLHEPGRAEIALRAGEAEQKQTVPVVAGAVVQVEFGGATGAERSAPPPSSPPERPPPPATRSSTSWATPAAIVSGSFTAVGLGVFTIFGLRSESAWDDLSGRCGTTGCGDADRPTANQGERDQIIANSGLVVASVAAVATVAFIVIAVTGSPSSNSASLFDGRRRSGL